MKILCESCIIETEYLNVEGFFCVCVFLFWFSIKKRARKKISSQNRIIIIVGREGKTKTFFIDRI